MNSTSHRLEAELRLSDVRAAGGSIRDLVAETAAVVDGVVYVLDPDEHIIASAAPCGAASIPRLAVLLDAIGSAGEPPTSVAVVPPCPQLPGRRHVIGPIAHDGHLFGYLVLGIPDTGETGDSGDTDHTDDDVDHGAWVAGRAATHLRGEFVAQRRLARVGSNVRANLCRQMLRSSTYDADLRACAEFLGVDLDAERMVIFVLERGRDAAVDPERLADLMDDELDREILPIRGSEGVLLAVTVPEGADHGRALAEVKGAVVRGLERIGDRDSVVGISSVTPAGRLRRAYREAREVARCVDRYGSPETRAVGCDELGPARLFVANSDENAVRLYVHDVLGSLLDGDEAMQVLLLTLQTFFETGRSVRESAAVLDVHENTVRHRLARAHELTGMDVAGASNDQLSVQTALLVLKLQGHRAFSGFGRGAGAPRRPRRPLRPGAAIPAAGG